MVEPFSCSLDDLSLPVGEGAVVGCIELGDVVAVCTDVAATVGGEIEAGPVASDEEDIPEDSALDESVDLGLEAAVAYDENISFVVLITVTKYATEEETSKDVDAIFGLHEAFGEVDLELAKADVQFEDDLLLMILIVVDVEVFFIERDVHHSGEGSLVGKAHLLVEEIPVFE